MAKDYQELWQNVTSAVDEAQAVRTLAEILADKKGRVFISRLERKSAELCIEILDHGIAEYRLEAAEKLAFFVTLRRLAGCYGRLPRSMMITEKVEVSDEILARGGFADIRSGNYMGHPVAIKTMKITENDDLLKIRKQFCKEVILWSTLSHPNILELVGVQGNMDKGQFSTVSEWMMHGNIMDYIKKNHANRLDLLHGAAQGLKYLHGASLTHGDLKGANILMSNHTPPRACLADFGFMTVVFDPVQPMSCSAQLEGGTTAFMSPELLVPSNFGMDNSLPTPEADIYAFGLVIFQVLTGEFPFRGIGQAQLGWSLLEGLRPDKPEDASSIGFSDSLWGFVQRCWDGDRQLRPNVAEVVTHLDGAAADWKGLMPPCVQTAIAVPSFKEETSDSMRFRKIFQPSSKVIPEGTTESQTISGLSSPPRTLSTQLTEQSQGSSVLCVEEHPEVVAKPSQEPQPESRGSMQSEPRDPVEPQPGEPHDDLDLPVHSHLNKRHDPPPSKIPRKKRKPFAWLLRMFHRIKR